MLSKNKPFCPNFWQRFEQINADKIFVVQNIEIKYEQTKLDNKRSLNKGGNKGAIKEYPIELIPFNRHKVICSIFIYFYIFKINILIF